MRELILMTPPTSKTTMRLAWETASRREPVPESLWVIVLVGGRKD